LPLFLANEGPDFIGLNVIAAKVAHPVIHQLEAGLTGENEQTADCVPMQSSDALCAPNAVSLKQKPRRQDGLLLGNVHRVHGPLMCLSVGLVADRAAETPQAITMLAEALTINVALFACH
jgi:hypothetical protein